MLILTRKENENVYLVLPNGKTIRVTYCGNYTRQQAKLGFTADRDVIILREEVFLKELNDRDSVVYKKLA